MCWTVEKVTMNEAMAATTTSRKMAVTMENPRCAAPGADRMLIAGVRSGSGHIADMHCMVQTDRFVALGDRKPYRNQTAALGYARCVGKVAGAQVLRQQRLATRRGGRQCQGVQLGNRIRARLQGLDSVAPIT